MAHYTKLEVSSRVMIAIALMVFAMSCQSPKSKVAIDAGNYIQTDSENKASGVVAIQIKTASGAGMCSATIVSTDTIFTAAHCLGEAAKIQADGRAEAEICIVGSAFYIGKCTTKVFADPGYANKNIPRQVNTQNGIQVIMEPNYGYDFAVATFDGQPFKHYHQYASAQRITPADIGMPLLMVGYSQKNPGQNFKGNAKRWGTNAIDDFDPSEFNSIGSSYRGNAESVAVSPGDSGGPIFNQCKVIGVASRRGQTIVAPISISSIHTNITSEQSRSFLDMAVRLGAHICDDNNIGSEFCPASYLFKPVANPAALADGTPGFPCDQTRDNGKLAADDNGAFKLFARPETNSQALDKAVVYISSAFDDKVVVCRNSEVDACVKSDLKIVHVRDLGAGRTIYKIEQTQSIDLQDAKKNLFTMVHRDNNGAVIKATKITFTPKP